MSLSSDGSQSPRWASRWLWVAGIYNLTWGTLTIAWPHSLFDLTGAQRINYPEIWQCVGMIVGVYGVGYIIAASDSRTHWPIVLVGLLGKVFGPIGFLVALLRGTFPPLFGLTILTNDLLWWIPFTMILLDAAKYQRANRRSNGTSRQQYVKQIQINAPPDVVFRFQESPDALPHLIPRQRAAALPPDSIRLEARVVQVAPGVVTLSTGEELSAKSVVVAIEGRMVAERLGETISSAGQGTTCIYFTAPRPSIAQPLPVLNGDGRGPINNLCVPTVAAPSYGPGDKSLVSVTVLGTGNDPDRLLAEVRAQLGE